ncbi:acetylserotonin O-methyltransferase [Jannaschia sp. S6380]|uniref:acetylserotonin O-methyltransferase n=1 Tax=Jannaschia sp. S6380 TaxID=2926408 RepID=UPI001FF42013|nr:acetylserotonin O-methyltransferase [Jannaschia sp. S6380]MCK0167681.1 acetylserotonin O-methyltransferase [Jannaschia sp. S6380]
MVTLDGPPPRRRAWPLTGWRARLIANPRFQNWAARFPPTRGLVRRDGAALFDLVAGFCHSQVLAALVEFDVLAPMLDGDATIADLAQSRGVPAERMRVLLNAGAALGLLRRRRSDRFALTRKGAALLGVPGLCDMIRHHRALYRDLSDPVAFFRGETATEVAAFWPYVLGDRAADDGAAVDRYSDLMARSLDLVARDTLDACDLSGVKRLLDVGGGTGLFLAAAGRRHPHLRLSLLDLPDVVTSGLAALEAPDLRDRVTVHPGSFRDDPLPKGCDAISLVRVLYDHSDETVRALLAAAYEALPPGGLLLISEPMSGGARPARAGDAYFAIYTVAMGTGRTRSADELAGLCRDVGFRAMRPQRAPRPYITSVLTCRRP